MDSFYEFELINNKDLFDTNEFMLINNKNLFDTNEFILINNKNLFDTDEIQNIYNSISINFFLILFGMSFLSTILIFYKKPITKKNYLILPSYEKYVNDSINISEGTII